MHHQTLAQTPPFDTLPAEEIQYLLSTLPVIEFAPGAIFFQEGHRNEDIYILLEGQVEIIKSFGSEDERVLGVRGAGTLLGEMSLFSRDGSHTASVRSLTPLQLMKISPTDLDDLLLRQPQLAYEIIRMFSTRLEETENAVILDLREKNRRLQQAYDELRAAHEQIVEKERLEKELEISNQIQRSILPESLPDCMGYEFGALMIPARQVGGDFYTFLDLGKNRLGIVVGDVCDKGVPAALFMALSYSLIRAEAVRTNSPVKALRSVNAHLLQMNSMGFFVSFVYGILDCNTGVFHFARGAHPSPFLLDEHGQVVKVPVSPGQPLGLFDNLPIDEQTVHIPPGGILALYTDGVNEPENLQGVEFGLESLSRSITGQRMRPAQEICDLLWQDVQQHSRGIPQQDDFTAVVIKRRQVHEP